MQFFSGMGFFSVSHERLNILTGMQRRAHEAYRPGENTQREAAAVLGLTREALAMRLHRLRRKLGLPGGRRTGRMTRVPVLQMTP